MDVLSYVTIGNLQMFCLVSCWVDKMSQSLRFAPLVAETDVNNPESVKAMKILEKVLTILVS